MLKTITYLMFFTTAISPAWADSESSVDSAYKVCAIFDGTGMLTEPCSVSGWHSSVDVKIDTNGSEARQICAGVVEVVRDQEIRFDTGWRLRIYSPFSGDSTIAQCDFR